jgi:hypothetical protein
MDDLDALPRRKRAAIVAKDRRDAEMRSKRAGEVVFKHLGGSTEPTESELEALFPQLFATERLKDFHTSSRQGSGELPQLRREEGSDGVFLTEVDAAPEISLPDVNDADSALHSESDAEDSSDETPSLFPDGDPRGLVFRFGKPPLGVNTDAVLDQVVDSFILGTRTGKQRSPWEGPALRGLKKLAQREETQRLTQDSLWLAHCSLWHNAATCQDQEDLLDDMALHYCSILQWSMSTSWHQRSNGIAMVLYPYVVAWSACEALISMFPSNEDDAGEGSLHFVDGKAARLAGIRRGRVCHVILSTFSGSQVLWQFHVTQFRRLLGNTPAVVSLSAYSPEADSASSESAALSDSTSELLANELRKARKREMTEHANSHSNNVVDQVEDRDLTIPVSWSQHTLAASASNVQHRGIDVNEVSPLISRQLRANGTRVRMPEVLLSLSEVLESARVRSLSVLDYSKDEVAQEHSAVKERYDRSRVAFQEAQQASNHRAYTAVQNVELEKLFILNSNSNEVHRFSAELLAQQSAKEERHATLQNQVRREVASAPDDSLPVIQPLSSVMFKANWTPLTRIKQMPNIDKKKATGGD